jgi:hypothetical protein
MKSLISFKPVFVPGSSGVGYLDFSAYPNFDTERLYAVINVTRNTALYIPGAPNLGATESQLARIYLTADTSTHNAADNLNIYYEARNTLLEANAAQESGGNLDQLVQLQQFVLLELKVMNILLKEGLNIKEELEVLRNSIEEERISIG